MFQMPDEEVSAEFGVKLETIANWRKDPEFKRALAAEERAIKAAAARITSDASLVAAKNLHGLLSGPTKDGKLSLDTLKASGAFDGLEEEGETLEDLVREMAADDGTDN
jgi:hypothetical protein